VPLGLKIQRHLKALVTISSGVASCWRWRLGGKVGLGMELSPSGVQGKSPDGGLGAKPPEAEAIC